MWRLFPDRRMVRSCTSDQPSSRPAPTKQQPCYGLAHDYDWLPMIHDAANACEKTGRALVFVIFPESSRVDAMRTRIKSQHTKAPNLARTSLREQHHLQPIGRQRNDAVRHHEAK